MIGKHRSIRCFSLFLRLRTSFTLGFGDIRARSGYCLHQFGAAYRWCRRAGHVGLATDCHCHGHAELAGRVRSCIGWQAIAGRSGCRRWVTAKRAVPAPRIGGALIIYGDMSNEPRSIPALLVAIRNLRIEGVSVGDWTGLPAAQRHDDLHAALDLAVTILSCSLWQPATI